MESVIVVAVLCGALLALLVEVVIMRSRLARLEKQVARYRDAARKAQRGAEVRQAQIVRGWRDMPAQWTREN